MNQNVWGLINGDGLRKYLSFTDFYTEKEFPPLMKKVYDIIEKSVKQVTEASKPEILTDKIVKVKLNDGYAAAVIRYSEPRGISFEFDITGFQYHNSLFTFRNSEGKIMISNFLE